MTNHYLMKNFSKFSFRYANSFIVKALLLVLTLMMVSVVQAAEDAPLAQAGAAVGEHAEAISQSATADNPAAAAAAAAAELRATETKWSGMLSVKTGNDPLPGFKPMDHSFTYINMPHHIRRPRGFTPKSDACRTVKAEDVIKNLSYMGNKFPATTRATCVLAYTDLEAAEKGGRYINPANPEYVGRVEVAGATQAYNPDGYYIRIENLSVNSKQQLCRNANFDSYELPSGISPDEFRAYLSPRPQIYDNENAGGGPDVVCTCITGRTLDNPEGVVGDCTGANFTTAVAGAMVQIRAAQQTVAAARLQAAPAPALARTAGSANNPPPDPVIPPTPAANDVAQCIEQAFTQSQNCKRLSDSAKAACNRAREENSPMDATGAILGAGSDINTMRRAGTGAQANCMRASAITMGARELMRQFGANCDSEVNACKDTCKSDGYDSYIDRCLTQKGSSVALLEAAPNTDPAATAFRRRDEAIRVNYNAGVRVCNQELPRAQSDVSNLMTGMGNSLQASMQCACQTSNAAGANCQAVPNVNNCDTNPSLAGCEVYGPLGSCVPGNIGYDAKTCNCLQNPAAAGCSGTSGPTPASLFGNNLRVAPAAGGTFAGGGAAAAGGGGRASNLDLNSAPDAVQSNLSGDATSGSAKSAGAAYGGSVSGGGGGNGNAAEEAAAAGAPPESGLSGLFNQAKNAVMGAIGRGSNRTTRATAKGAVKEANMKKFKPLRGLANSEGMGSRNMDIWKMVNMCANGETCASNRNNYMMAP